MKSSKFNFKYLYLSLIDAAFVFALLFINFAYDDTMAAESYLSYADLFMLLGVPVFLILRAVLSQVHLKNAFTPNLMLLADIFLGLPLLSGEIFRGDWAYVLRSLAVAAIFAAISMVISLITGLIVRLFRT